MKTTQQKKKAIKNKLDRLIQQIYRKPSDKCLVCGERAEVLHHFVQKSQSMYLRWDPSNLIPLTNSCHCRHHITGDPMVVATIVQKKGQKWLEKIQEDKNKPFDSSLTGLRELLEKLEAYEDINFGMYYSGCLLENTLL